MMTPAELSNKLEQIQGRISICLHNIYKLNQLITSGTADVFNGVRDKLVYNKQCFLRALDRFRRMYEIYYLEYMDKLELIIKESI